MKNGQLPPGWAWKTLAEVAAPQPNAIVDGPFGSNLKVEDYRGTGIPVLQGKNVTNDKFRWFDIRYISPIKAAQLKRSSVRVGDILMVKIGSIGYSAYVDDLAGAEFAIIPANLAKVTPNPAVVDLGYLLHWLKSESSKRYLVGSASKTAQPALSLTKIKLLPIPLPRICEQRRLAAILDKAEALRTKRRQALAKLDTLTQSLFHYTFSDCKQTLPLSSVGHIVSGVTKSARDREKLPTTIPYLRVANVQAGFLNLQEIKTITASEKEIEAYSLKAGDVLLTEGGDHDKLGRGAIWHDEIAPCIHQNHVFRVRLDQNTLLPEVFNLFLQTRPAKAYFLRCAKKTSNLASINMGQLRKLPTLVPDIALQRHFVSEVTKLSSIAQASSTGQTETDTLFASLQHRAFQGDL